MGLQPSAPDQFLMTQGGMPTKILIADDHPLFRTAISYTLTHPRTDADGTVVDPGGRFELIEASSLSTLETELHAHQDLDLVLLDLNMPGANGFSSLILLRGERPEVPVIIISSNDHPRTIRRALQFGAAGFLSKSATVEEVHQAIAVVLNGGQWFAQEKAARSEDDARLANKLSQLTPQQVRVLMCLADGLLNKQIAGELGLAENTVKVHVTAVLRKLDCHSRTQAAVLVKSLNTEEAWPGNVPNPGLNDDPPLQ